MSRVRVVLDKKAVRDQLLKSSEMMDICLTHAQRTADAAGDGYEITTHVGKNRVNAQVRAITKESIRDNIENNTLLRSLR